MKETEQKLLMEAAYPQIREVKAYLDYCKLSAITTDEPDEEGNVRLYCDERIYAEAKKHMDTFIEEEKKKEAEEAGEETEEAKLPSNMYQNCDSRAAENKTSAISFLLIGTLGAVFVALSWFGRLPFSIGGSGNWFTHATLFSMFVIFALIGIVSAKNVGKYRELAKKEADEQNTLKAYLAEQFTKEVLSEIGAKTEEEAYFKRMSFMREQVMQAFPDSAFDDTFMEALLDEYYDSVFG